SAAATASPTWPLAPTPVITDSTACRRLSDVFATERGPHGLAHGDHCTFARRGAVFAHMNLDTVRDVHATPCSSRFVRAPSRQFRVDAQRWRERRGDAAFQCVAGEILHFLLDNVECGALALTDLDGEQLEQVSVVVRGRRAGAIRSIEKAACHIEPHRAGARRRTG